MKYVYGFFFGGGGGGKRLFGSFQRKFRDEMVQIVQICTKEYATIIYNNGLPDPVAIPD